MYKRTSKEVVLPRFLRNTLVLAMSCTLLACSQGVEDLAPAGVAEASANGADVIASTPILGAAGPSRSAAELANDVTQTPSFARQVADIAAANSSSDNNPLAITPEAPANTSPNTDTANSSSDNNPLAITPEAPANTSPNTDTEIAQAPIVPQTATVAIPQQPETTTVAPATNQTPTTTDSNNESTESVSETTSSESNSPIETNSLTTSAPPPGSIIDETPDNTVGTEFQSLRTQGFVGQVLDDGTIRVRWNDDPTARGYNIYRQAEYITTVFDTEYIDTDVFDTNYYYEIEAFDFADNFTRIATGLTVKVRGLDKPDPNAPVANAALLQDYTLVFSDEFDGNTLDSSKWNTAYLWGTDLFINSEEQYYVDVNNDPEFGFNPFSFDGENLSINSIRTPEALKQKALNQPYLSGVITSNDAFKFTYGYVEARAKVPYGKGLWPAFWLLNAYYVDDEPEIDIMEFIGDDQDVVYHTYHYYDSDDVLRSTESAPTVGIDYTADFHTYAVEWKPGTLVFYVDGIERHRVVDSKVSQQEMYVIANTAIGGWWPGSPDETTPFPAQYQIDYIRVYQKTTPFNDVVLDDSTSAVPLATNVPGTSPNHRPSFEQWPEGYPER